MPTAVGARVLDRSHCHVRSEDDKDNEAARWDRLKKWVQQYGGGDGYVHPDLDLVVAVDDHVQHRHKKESDDVDDGRNEFPTSPLVNRGIVATRFIAKGTLLLRIPSGLALGLLGHCDPAGGGAAAVMAYAGDASVHHHNRSNAANNRADTINNERGSPNRSISDDDDDDDDPAIDVPPSTTMGCSPWLECLIALHEAQQQQQQTQASPLTSDAQPSNRLPRTWKPYLDSLPTHFDTLLDWTDDQLQFLSGTSIHVDHPSQEQMLRDLRTRYVSNVRPKLVERGLVPESSNNGDDADNTEFERFKWACQAISTRCFHVDVGQKLNTHSNSQREDDDDKSRGPYFLPVIDLLNHSNGSDRVTSLTAVPTSNGNDIQYFEMVAERDVKAGEPVTHSYGTDLTSAQCLQTFGFVPVSATKTVAAAAETETVSAGAASIASAVPSSPPSSNHVSPAILSKDLVLACCQRTVEEERQSRDAVMKDNGVRNDYGGDEDDETWELPTSAELMNRDVSSLPDHIVVNMARPLSDDLVTLLSLPFLPDDAYRELILDPPPASDGAALSSSSSFPPPPYTLISRLGASVLEDPYLGRLVGQTLLDVVKEKAGTYHAILIEVPEAEEERDDRSLLNNLLLLKCEAGPNRSSSATASRLGALDATTRQRLLYALTIRLEERSCLEALRREAVRILLRATDDDNADADAEDDSEGDYDSRRGGEGPRTKRQNTNA